MSAKFFYRFTLMLIVMMTSFLVMADSAPSQSQSSKTTGSTILYLKTKAPKTKRAPSRNFLEVKCFDGTVTLLSETYNGEFSLSFENCESGECYVIPSICVGESVSFELMVGGYQVDAIGVDATVLTGVMDVQ